MVLSKRLRDEVESIRFTISCYNELEYFLRGMVGIVDTIVFVNAKERKYRVSIREPNQNTFTTIGDVFKRIDNLVEILEEDGYERY